MSKNHPPVASTVQITLIFKNDSENGSFCTFIKDVMCFFLS